MKRLASYILFFLLMFNFFPLVTVNAQDYVIDGDVVYIDDENVRIAVYPHTSSGGWVYLNFTSKRYSGELDFLFGFNSDVSRPVKAEVYNPTIVETIRSYVVPEWYYSDPDYKVTYTFSSQDASWLYDGVVSLWSWNGSGWDFDFNYLFERANKKTKTLYWQQYSKRNWVKLTKDKLDWARIDHEFKDMDRWYYFSNNVVEDRLYHLRIWVDVVPSLSGGKNKFWVACKRSDQTLQESIQSGQLYYLDPWYDSDWTYRKLHNVTGSSGAGTNYQIPIDVNYGSGIDGGNSVYCGSNCQADFDDIRFTEDDGETLLYLFREEYTSSDDATFWVNVTDNLDSGNVTIYMYYGNDAASSGSDGSNTMVFFDDFNDYSINDYPNGDLWTTTGIQGSNNITVQQDPDDASLKCFEIDESGDNVNTGLWFELKSNLTGYAFHSRYRVSVDEKYNMGGRRSGDTAIITGRRDDDDDRYEWYDTAWRATTPTWAWSVNTWYVVIEKLEDSGGNYLVYDVDGVDRIAGFRNNGGVDYGDFIAYRLTDYYAYLGGVGEDNRFIFIRKFVDPEPSNGDWGEEETEVLPVGYYYITSYFENGLIVYLNGSSVSNGSENAYVENATLPLNSVPENANWEFFGYERQTYNNFTLDNPISIDLIANETVWVYSEIEGEPLLYETVLLFSLLWISLLFFSIFKPNLLLKGGAVIVGFILALEVHSSIATTFGSLLGFAVVCINVGLLVSVLFEK